MIRVEGWPPVKNQEWFAEIPGAPIRKIVSELCAFGRTAVGKYIKEPWAEAEFAGRLCLGGR